MDKLQVLKDQHNKIRPYMTVIRKSIPYEKINKTEHRRLGTLKRLAFKYSIRGIEYHVEELYTRVESAECIIYTLGARRCIGCVHGGGLPVKWKGREKQCTRAGRNRNNNTIY